VPRKTPGRGEIAGLVAPLAIGAEELVALHRGATCRPGDLGEHTAQGVGEQIIGVVGGKITDQLPTEHLVIGVELVAAATTVDMLLQTKGVDRHGRAAAVRRTAQDAVATGIVGLPICHGRVFT